MGIRRIAYLFDVEKFRDAFEPFIPQLERSEFFGLRKKAHDLTTNNMVIWHVLEDIGYFRDDLGKEDETFDDLERVKFWILILLSSFCMEPDYSPVDARSTRELLESVGFDKEVTMKLTWGRPLGHLLMPKGPEHGSTLERDDTSWPYWCRSYGSLGWLSVTEVPPLLKALEELSSQDLELIKSANHQGLIDFLKFAIKNNKGLFLGVSA